MQQEINWQRFRPLGAKHKFPTYLAWLVSVGGIILTVMAHGHSEDSTDSAGQTTTEHPEFIPFTDFLETQTAEFTAKPTNSPAIRPLGPPEDESQPAMKVAARNTAEPSTRSTMQRNDKIVDVFGDVLIELADERYIDAESISVELRHLRSAHKKKSRRRSHSLAANSSETTESLQNTRPTSSSSEPEASVKNVKSVDERLNSGFELAPSSGIKITREMQALKVRIAQCLSIYKRFYLNTSEHGCWSTMHSILALGPEAMIHVGGPRGPTRNAVEWLCNNQPCSHRRLFVLHDGRLKGLEGPGYQGHPAQFLAMLAQIQIPPKYPIRVEETEFTVADLIEQEKRTCHLSSELTFKLIGLLHYMDSEEVWQSDDGQKWSFPRLIQSELAQPINGAACGGTHRIMALSYAARKRQHRGEEVSGQWWRAEKFMNDYHRYTMTLQNRDGSFSSDWFKGRSDVGEKDRQLQTTGHILEWLAFSLPEDRLSDYRVVRSVAFLTNLMIANRYYDWDKGPRAHAIRALNLYYWRVFGNDLEIPRTPIIQQFTKDQEESRTRRIFNFRF